MSVVINPTSKIITRLNLETNGKIHKFFTNTCALHMDKYVPMREGLLAGTVVSNGVVTSNVTTNTITYDQQYASYQYYGQRKDGSRKIVNRTLTKHPLATSYWDKVMVSAEMQDIEKEVQDEMKRVGGK